MEIGMEEIKKVRETFDLDGKDLNSYKETLYKKIEEKFNMSVIIDKKISESAKQI
jgi:hypothetical protein